MTNLEIECLKCHEIYDEKLPEVEICPHCGNDDMTQTIYLSSERK